MWERVLSQKLKWPRYWSDHTAIKILESIWTEWNWSIWRLNVFWKLCCSCSHFEFYSAYRSSTHVTTLIVSFISILPNSRFWASIFILLSSLLYDSSPQMIVLSTPPASLPLVFVLHAFFTFFFWLCSCYSPSVPSSKW